MIKSIIFDMDGVLIDSYTSWFKSFNNALTHFENKAISEEEFKKYVWAKGFEETSKKYFSVPKDEVIDYFEQNSEDFEKTITLFPDTKETLRNLKEKKLLLTVATNTHKELAKRMLEGADILQFFDYIIGGNSVEKGKPHPDMLIKTLEELNLRKEETLFIGDTIWDKMAAEEADIRFIGKDLESEENISSLSELNKFLN